MEEAATLLPQPEGFEPSPPPPRSPTPRSHQQRATRACAFIGGAVALVALASCAWLASGVRTARPQQAVRLDSTKPFPPLYSPDAFISIDILEALGWRGKTGENIFSSGALSLNDTVVMDPNEFHGIGIFDASTKRFEVLGIHPKHGDSWEWSAQFWGAVALRNSDVVFVPYNAPKIGLYAASRNEFLMISLPDEIADERYKWMGGVLLPNDDVVFAPYDINVVGVFRPSTSTFATIPIKGGSAESKYAQPLLLSSGDVLFPPANSPEIGILRSTTGTFETLHIPDLPAYPKCGGEYCYYGALELSDGRVFLSPNDAEYIVLVDLAAASCEIVDIRESPGYQGSAWLSKEDIISYPGWGATTNSFGFFRPATKQFSKMELAFEHEVGSYPYGGGVTLRNGDVVLVPHDNSFLDIFAAGALPATAQPSAQTTQAPPTIQPVTAQPSAQTTQAPPTIQPATEQPSAQTTQAPPPNIQPAAMPGLDKLAAGGKRPIVVVYQVQALNSNIFKNSAPVNLQQAGSDLHAAQQQAKACERRGGRRRRPGRLLHEQDHGLLRAREHRTREAEEPAGRRSHCHRPSAGWLQRRTMNARSGPMG